MKTFTKTLYLGVISSLFLLNTACTSLLPAKTATTSLTPAQQEQRIAQYKTQCTQGKSAEKVIPAGKMIETARYIMLSLQQLKQPTSVEKTETNAERAEQEGALCMIDKNTNTTEITQMEQIQYMNP